MFRAQVVYSWLVIFAVTLAGNLYANVDSDSDGMPDDWETANGLDPNFNDAGRDHDDDQLVNLEEFNEKSDPQNPDTDSDTMLDGLDVTYGSSPIINDQLSTQEGIHIYSGCGTALSAVVSQSDDVVMLACGVNGIYKADRDRETRLLTYSQTALIDGIYASAMVFGKNDEYL